MYGHIYRMSEAVVEGAREVEGAEVSLYQVAELVPEEALEKIGANSPWQKCRFRPSPTGLGLLPAPDLAFRLPAGMLAISHMRVRPEPPAADRARSLPGLWLGDAS
jgi:hypothetical protein